MGKKFPRFFTFLALASSSESFLCASSSSRGLSGNTPPSFRMTSSDTRASIKATTWSEDTTSRETALERCIVPLSSSSYKGSSGRVGVLGGSARYTGAPYYAAMASLKCGADLAFCFCAEEAAIPLKSYSPELMVAPVYNAADFGRALRKIKDVDDEVPWDDETNELIERMVEQICNLMDKMHVLVLGPGLGRCPLVLEATARIIRRAQKEYHLPLVLDADALFLLTLPKYQSNLLSNESPVILTPNAMEKKRLVDSGHTTESLPDNCWMIEKGSVDTILPAATAFGATKTILPTMICGEVGGLKRSGGIGDILAGTCGTLVAWNTILSSRGKASPDDLSLACWTACCFVKRSTKKAFEIHRRSMTAPDILHELGPVIDEMTTT